MSWSGALLTPAPGFRRQTRQDGLATMASIDVAELGVDRQEDTIRVDLRHADQTSVSKVPPASPDDGLDGRDLVSKAEGRRHDAPCHQLQDRLRASWPAPRAWAAACGRSPTPRSARGPRSARPS